MPPRRQLSYRCITVSLANGFATPTLVPGTEPNQPITGVLVLQAPAGTQGSLSFGQGGDAIPIVQGFEIDASVYEAIIEGVFITAPVQAGASIVLFLTFQNEAVASLGAT